MRYFTVFIFPLYIQYGKHSKDNQTVRCDECWNKHQKELRTLQNKRYYNKKKN